MPGGTPGSALFVDFVGPGVRHGSSSCVGVWGAGAPVGVWSGEASFSSPDGRIGVRGGRGGGVLGAVCGTCTSVRFDGAVLSTRRPRLPNDSQIASAFIKFIFPRAVWRSTQCVFDVLAGIYLLLLGADCWQPCGCWPWSTAGRKGSDRVVPTVFVLERPTHTYTPSNDVHGFDRVEAPAASPCLGFAHPGGDWRFTVAKKAPISS